MADLAVAFGLVLDLEGLMWALSPGLARRLLEMASEVPPADLKKAGWAAVAIGAFIVWLIRG